MRPRGGAGARVGKGRIVSLDGIDGATGDSRGARGAIPRAAACAGRRMRRARFFAYRPAVYSLVLLSLVLAISLGAPLFAPHGRDAIDLDRLLAPPSADHPLGTDELGRDTLTRVIYAGRYSLLVAFAAVSIAAAIGVLAGAAAGFFGGAVDAGVAIAIDLFLSVPVFLVLLAAAAAAGERLWLIPVIIGAASWVETARVVRSLVQSLGERGFVDAARAIGAGRMRLLARHLLPGAMPAVIVAATTGFAQAMIAESALSFLGFGVQPPAPTWGNMLQNAHLFIREAPVAAFAPGFMIFITCLAFHYAGEGLRRTLAVGDSGH